ncbi:MAG: EAL domain-containing protein [Deltaproteobacteria bacterium]|nr:EAL domain-containing protein [Deltaproteobacteria bacterium]
MRALQETMDAFYALTSVGIGIIDLEGRVLVATGWQDICVNFHRVHPATCDNCIESDTALTRGVMPGEFRTYRCKNNMYDIATPLVVGGEHVGNIFLGQFFFEDEPVDIELFRAQAHQYGFDEDAYLDALARTPRWSRSKVQSVMTFYARFAHLLSDLGLRNKQLKEAIEERETLLVALRERQDRLRYTFERAPIGGAILSIDFKFLEVNESFAQFTGYVRDELLTRSLAEITHPADVARNKGDVSRLLRGEIERLETEKRYVHKSGAIVWGQVVANCVRDEEGQPLYLIAIVLDVTAKKAAERALTESEAQYRAVIETSQDGFLICDPNGQILEANEAYADMSGYTRAELQAMRLPDIEAQDRLDDIRERLHVAARQGGALFNSKHRTKSGRVIDVEVNISYWPIAEGRFFGFVRDLNRRQRSERILKARLELSEMAETASIQEMLARAADFATALADSDAGRLVLADELGTVKDDSGDLARRCLETGRAVIVNAQAPSDEMSSRDAPATLQERALVVPVTMEGRVTAILGVTGKSRDYTPEDEAALSQFASIVVDIIDRKLTEARIAHLAFHDPLTQLPNRALLTDRLNQALVKARRSGLRFAVCYLDLDNFKPINDAFGHAQGDAVLIEIASRLRESIRRGDTVARFGGDEFVILFEDLKSPDESAQALDRVMKSLKRPFCFGTEAFEIRVSIGITVYPDDESDADALLRHVDQAMYAAKQAGGDRCEIFDAEDHRRSRTHKERLQRIRDGLLSQEFELHYQPKVDMVRGTVLGVEALLRWQHPTEGLLAPGSFMPSVENTDLALEIDRWVIERSLAQMSTWRAAGLDISVSVNLSARQLQQLDFITQLRDLLTRYPEVPRARLEFEVLETTSIEAGPALALFVEGCKRLGIRFAIDDFGTGYSSLSYLRTLPAHQLKIDRTFVRDMLTNRGAMALVMGVIGLARAFAIEVIAEGVETTAQGVRLIELGCPWAQGYSIARPMTADKLPAWIATWRPPSAWSALDARSVEVSSDHAERRAPSAFGV